MRTNWDLYVILVPFFLIDCTENEHWNRSFFPFYIGKTNGCDSSLEMIIVPLTERIAGIDYFRKWTYYLERITQTMDDCKFFRQYKYSAREIIDDCLSFYDKNRYHTSDKPYKIGCLR